ncbi:histidine kinase [Winogradskyella maritima]|uniref:histidine kinase n=1 Tax=Winogradskyella maritima TaxID=1517766 RepID=A0ABV8AKC7_9FLAO|nr:histidine kinase [Winogradskyella maritima]
MKSLRGLLLCSAFIISYTLTYSQSEEKKLLRAIELGKDSSLIEAYFNLGKFHYFKSGKGDSLIFYGTKALNLSQSLNYDDQYLESIKYIGTGHFANGDYDKANDFFYKGLNHSESLNNKKSIADFHFRLGTLSQNVGDNKQAISHMVSASTYSKQIDDYKTEANAYYGISGIYAEEKQEEKQLEYIEKSLQIIKNHKINDAYLETIIYTDASETYLENYIVGNEKYFENLFLTYSAKALSIATKNKFEGRKNVLYSIFGKYFNHKGDYNKAHDYALKIINSDVRVTDASLINAYSLLVKSYTKKNNQPLAYRYLDSLNTLNLKYKASYGEAISTLSYETYKYFGNKDLALKAIEERIEHMKELNDLSKSKALNELEVKYQSQIKDSEIKNLSQQQRIDALELKNKQAEVNHLSFLLVVGIAFIVVFFLISKHLQLKKVKLINNNLSDALHKQLELEKELSDVRDEIAQDFHDDLGNKLARISLLSNLVSGESSIKNSKIKSKIKQITDDANGLYQGTRDFVFSLKSNSDYIEEVATYLSDFGEDFFNKTPIKFMVQKNIVLDAKLPHYWNKQLIFIFKEAMTNALRHSKCTMVTLSFTYDNQRLKIECRDDGIGMSGQEIESSNGILNMKKRAEKIGGLLTINSDVETGTTVYFEGKTKDKHEA